MKKILRSSYLENENISVETKYEYENGLLIQVSNKSEYGDTVLQYKYDDAGKVIQKIDITNFVLGSQKREITDIQRNILTDGTLQEIETTEVEQDCCSYTNVYECIYESDGGKILETHSEDNESCYELSDRFFIYDSHGRVLDEYEFVRRAEWNDATNNYDIHFSNTRDHHTYEYFDGKEVETIIGKTLKLVDYKTEDTALFKDIIFEDNCFQEVSPTEHYFIEDGDYIPLITKIETDKKSDGSYVITRFNSVGDIVDKSDYDCEGNVLRTESAGMVETFEYE